MLIDDGVTSERYPAFPAGSGADTPEELLASLFQPIPSLPPYEASAEEIVQLIVAKRFTLKRQTVARETLDYVRTRVRMSLEARRPLRICIGQGGFKNPRLSTAPYADWAEVFHLRHFARRMTQLASVYPFGVELQYHLIDRPTEVVAGVSEASVRAYWDSMQVLVAQQQELLPAGVRLKLGWFPDLVPNYDAELAAMRARVAEEWNALPPERAAAEVEKTTRVFSHKPGISAHDIVGAAQVHLAMERLAYRNAEHDESIWLLMRKPIGPCMLLPARSCQTTICQHWAGTGVIVDQAGRFKTAILSPTQLSKACILKRIAPVTHDATNRKLGELLVVDEESGLPSSARVKT